MMNFKKKQKGFTLIEVLVAVLIFAMMMMAVSQMFASLIGGYKGARSIQKDLEDAQFIMNQMAKILRTSSIKIAPENSPANSIVAFDYSQNKCFKYQRTNDKKISFGSVDPPAATPITQDRIDFEKDTASWCNSRTFSLEPMAAFYVENTTPFSAVSSKPGSGSDGVLGKVTILLKICSNSSCTGDTADIQSSVSLRDYYKAGI